ncbi:MAG: hypothetical protein GTN69_11705, partial [Armatimonadetes bacterium]|nr:hypothetical protein [Armatimonadota bacterium]
MVRSLALSLVFIFTFFSSTAMAGETIVNLWQSNRQLVAVPRAIAVDNSNGSVWVADYGAGEIIHLASDGTTVLATVSGLAFGSPQASAIAVNPSNGSAWVADMQNDRVLNISSSGTILRTITSLSYPSSVAVNTSDDSVWIADRANGRVLNVSAAGTILANIGDFYAPNAIAYDQTRNLCWVTSSTNASHPETLNRLSWNGSSWVKTTSSIIGSSSLGICVNESNGHVWVADTYSRNVVRLDSSGAQLSVTTLPYNPMKVAVNSSSGEAWVAYKYPLDYVTRFNSSGGVVSDIHGFDAAESIAVNQSTGDVWVADTNNGQIVQLDS